MTERPGPVARLLGSFANALLDFGLPTIRGWLRDRVGPAAAVAQVTADGALVHLDGVRVPIGSRGLLLLERATVVVTALGRAGLPEMRLQAFTGVVTFGEAASEAFSAEVSFAASPEPEEAASIWGELTLHRVVRMTPSAKPIRGRARLFVSSKEWRLDDGRLEGEVVRARFSGSGLFDVPEGADTTGEGLLAPPALGVAALSLEQARIGPFMDAVSSLLGRAIRIPALVPVDAQLDGELAWSSADGGRAELRVGASAFRAGLGLSVGSTGRDLRGRIEADVHPALLLRGASVPLEAMPRDEDSVRVELEIAGELRCTEVRGTLRANELGFRFGRPRFVPAVVLRDLESDLFLKDDRAVLRAFAFAKASKVTIDVDANVRALASARAAIHANRLEAAFVRDVLRTLGLPLTVVDSVVASVDLLLAPSERGPSVSGTLGLTSTGSKLALALAPGDLRASGTISASDLVESGIVRGAVRPRGGEIAFELEGRRAESGFGLQGTAASAHLVLGIEGRPDVRCELEDISANVAVDRARLVYDRLRFRAHGGRFVANGTIPLASRSPADLLELRLEEGGAELACVVARLAVRSDPSGRHLRVAGDGARPAGELWLPRALRASGALRIGSDRALGANVSFASPAGSALCLAVHRRAGSFVGSSLAGRLALTDVASSGLLDAGEPTGEVQVEAYVAPGATAGPVVMAHLLAEAVEVGLRGARLAATDVTASLRFDGEVLGWKDVRFAFSGGQVASSGVAGRNGERWVRLSTSGVVVDELPTISGQAPSAFVRGRLVGFVVGRTDARGTSAIGDLRLEEAAFPALDRVRPLLARYGLRPPNEDAQGPVTAKILAADGAVSLRDVMLDLRGATVRGDLTVSRERTLDGLATVTLEEEYLRTSKLLTLPRVLSERLVVPVRLDGSLDAPRVHADLAGSLGRFLRDNRVSAFVTAAVEEAQILFGRDPTDPPRPPLPHRSGAERELDEELRARLDAHAEDWDELARRVAQRQAT